VRVLISHRYFWPENLTLFPVVLRDLVEWHVKRGDEVTVFSAEAVDPSGSTERHRWSLANDVELVELKLPIDRGGSAIRRAIHTARYTFGLYRLLAKQQYDLVYVASYPPLLPALVARWSSRHRDQRYVYHVQDIFPESIQQRAAWLRHATAPIRWLDAANQSHSAATITISDNMKQTLAKRGVNPRKLYVLPNYSIDKPQSAVPKGERKTPTIIYAGNHGKLQNLEFFLRAVQQAAKRCRFQVQMLGDGSELDRLKRLTAECQLANVAFLGSRPREEAQSIIAQADIGLVAAMPGLYHVAYPSKLMSYLTAGLPVLVQVENGTPVARFLAEEQLGTDCSPNDLEKAADAIVRIVEQTAAGSYDARSTAQRSQKLFSQEQFFQRYETMLSECRFVPTRRRAA
jgi:glycosyltransferase involved in cell wall biosynthesis